MIGVVLTMTRRGLSGIVVIVRASLPTPAQGNCFAHLRLGLNMETASDWQSRRRSSQQVAPHPFARIAMAANEPHS
jgi:hypothetical protein